MGLHSDTEIYRSIEALGDFVLGAAALMRRDLVRATALLIAEIERIDRQTDPASLPPG